MPRTLLVVDDSATMRKVFEITFAGEDITVFTHDGSESLMGQAREQRPVAAVVDVSLGGPDAYAIVRSLKSDASLGGLPVLLLHSEHSPVDESRAREAGADGTMQKPFDTQAAIDKIKQLMGSARPQAAAAPPPAPGPVVGPFAPPAGAGPRPTVAGTGPAAPPPSAASPAAAVRPAPPSGAGVGARPPVTGGAKATQMFVSPPPGVPSPAPVASPSPVNVQPPAPPSAPGRVVAAPPVGAHPYRAPGAQTAPAAGPPRRDSVELEVDLNGEDEAPATRPGPAPAAAPPPSASAPVASITAEVGQRVAAMGLSPAQVEAVTALTREVVERVVWEVVPQLAETLIREELKRLTAE